MQLLHNTVDGIRDVKLKIPCAQRNNSNNLKHRAWAQKWILKPCTWRDGWSAVYIKDAEGVSAANDTLESLALS